MNDFVRLITLQDANTRVVILGSSLLGLACGSVGALSVLRKRALVGDAVAHAALPGVCVAYLVVGNRNFAAFLLGALLFGVLCAAFIAAVRTYTRVKEDAATALAIGSFFGLGIALSRMIQSQPSGNRAGLDSFIFGKAASMVAADAKLISIVCAVVVLAIVLLYKELKLLCFDRDFAQSLGWPVSRLDLVLMGLVAVCTVVGLPAVGVVLMVSLLVIPASGARFWTDRLGVMIILSGLIGAIAGVLGTSISATAALPTGPMVTLSAASIFAVSFVVAPKRGIVAQVARQRRLRRRVGIQNVLRAAYEATEQRTDPRATWASSKSMHAGLRLAMKEGLVLQADADRYQLTRYGVEEAVKVVRAHRLWELFLTDKASVAIDHVDRDADQLEHVLPREVVERLEAQLRGEGRLPITPGEMDVPGSVHEIGGQP